MKRNISVKLPFAYVMNTSDYCVSVLSTVSMLSTVSVL
jgi:hypothetical protein